MKAHFPMASIVAAALCLASCGGGTTSQYDGPPEGAPDGLSYPDPNLFTQGVTIPTLVPVVTGNPTNYMVIPDLPAGLRLNADGTISGTPAEPRATATYLVTAGNDKGTSAFGVRITVQGRFTVGGVVSGLTGAGLMLTNNGIDNLAVTANGPFTFSMVHPVGAIYSVAVASQPVGQTCGVAQGSGYIANVNYVGVTVTCVAVASKTSRSGSSLVSAVQKLADSRTESILYLTCVDGLIDPMTGLPASGEALYQFPIESASPAQLQCGPDSAATDGAWIYVTNAATQTISVYARTNF